MRETSARLLRLLSLLQTRRDWAGADLAERLNVTPRTVRRDVDKLREIGYPVNATSGVGGGYQLGAGAEMPPLLLDDDEALAVAFGLQSAAGGSVAGIGEASLRALTKLRQVMPSRIQHRLDALRIDVVERPARSAVDASVLATVAGVCHNRERLRFDYRRHDGTEARREVEPYSLVRAGARWYLLGWDIMRDDWRSFRVDRMDPKIPTGPRFTRRELPDGGAAAFVAKGIDHAYTQVKARILLHAAIETIAPMVDEYWGTLESGTDDTCTIVLTGDSLQSIARWLYAFDTDFTVVEPAELRDECLKVAEWHSRVSERYRASTASPVGIDGP
ncbi:helix-turn-helix transcriptional regulator [Rhodococcoides kyotonense]|uniref:DNA-binding transcriptional regulator n=1 Tax=Rhodococcoides kyotonense TaxID=398843 RepID=A0A177YJ79_9NOCA|nr:YafY family protein [Rhodococcus kyotonensis]OAK55289.1 DNA-binding transcriptional regulator [Rhodococcus kyotonensis]